MGEVFAADQETRADFSSWRGGPCLQSFEIVTIFSTPALLVLSNISVVAQLFGTDFYFRL